MWKKDNVDKRWFLQKKSWGFLYEGPPFDFYQITLSFKFALHGLVYKNKRKVPIQIAKLKS